MSDDTPPQSLGAPLPSDISDTAFADLFSVSRETQAKFAQYHEHLLAGQQTSQLVGRATLQQFWHRHIADCAQALPLLPQTRAWVVDIGTGAGLPTIVWALLAPQLEFFVVESRRHKAEFVRRIALALQLPIHLHIGRAEQLRPQNLPGTPAVVTARAVAPLADLLAMTQFAFAADTYGIFFKGKNWAKELTHARQSWTMTCNVWQSRTERDARVLVIRDPIARKKHA